MTTTTDTDSGFVIDTPDGLAYFALLQCIHRLKLETETGLGFRTSTLAAANRAYGLKIRTKKEMLATLLNVQRMILEEDHVLWPISPEQRDEFDGAAYGLFEREALQADIDRHLALYGDQA